MGLIIIKKEVIPDRSILQYNGDYGIPWEHSFHSAFITSIIIYILFSKILFIRIVFRRLRRWNLNLLFLSAVAAWLEEEEARLLTSMSYYVYFYYINIIRLCNTVCKMILIFSLHIYRWLLYYFYCIPPMYCMLCCVVMMMMQTTYNTTGGQAKAAAHHISSSGPWGIHTMMVLRRHKHGRKQRRIVKDYCSLSLHFILLIDNVEFFGRQ